MHFERILPPRESLSPLSAILLIMAVYSRRKNSELVGVVLLLSSLMFYMALFSYDAMDPSFNVASPDQAFSNLTGRIGAWASDCLLQLVGMSAFLLPVPLIFVGYRNLRTTQIENPVIKLVGFMALVLSLSALLSVTSFPVPQPANFSSGGILGIAFAELLEGYLNWVGSLVLLCGLFLLAVIITTRFSFEAAFQWVEGVPGGLFGSLSDRMSVWRERRRNRRELARLQKEKRTLVAHQVPKKPLPGMELADEAVAEGMAQPDTEAFLHPTRRQAHAESSRPRTVRAAKVPEPPRFQLPSLDFLQAAEGQLQYDEKELMERAETLTQKLAEFDVIGRVLQIHPGPVVTTFEFKPDPGIKYSRITNLEDDLCLGLRAESVRIDRIAGKNTVGIEVPNLKRRIIFLRETLSSSAFQRSSSRLTLGLGQLINGANYATDLAKMPHLLIAGSTGSGKSVGLNCMVCSILFKSAPEEVRFIMVDLKRLELGLYEGIPHLLTPIVTDPKKAANALNWAVRQMEERYRILAQKGVRNIDQFNEVIVREGSIGLDGVERLPYIVVIIDELADLMMTAGKEVEIAVTRLAQMARAVGIHLILATQRPSVDVITGLIKANFPSRISFRVSSKVDSRTILDSNGAEQLLGMGDMLFLSPATSRLLRIHGCFISEKEIGNITTFLKAQGEPSYREEILEGEPEEELALSEAEGLSDELFEEAARFVVETRKASTSLLQRRFRVGYGRAARLLDIMEHDGIIGPPDGSKPREVLVPISYFDEIDQG